MGVTIWILVAMLVGFVGFFVLAIVLAFHVGRSIFRAFLPRSKRSAAGREPSVLCPHPGCGHLNERVGLYCSRCGRRLGARREIDAYG